jgi:hypothetical protein
LGGVGFFCFGIRATLLIINFISIIDDPTIGSKLGKSSLEKAKALLANKLAIDFA